MCFLQKKNLDEKSELLHHQDRINKVYSLAFQPHLETSGVRRIYVFQYAKVSDVSYLFWSYSLLEVVSFFKKKLFVVACIQVIHYSMVIVS